MQKKIRNILLIVMTLFTIHISKTKALETGAYCEYAIDSYDINWVTMQTYASTGHIKFIVTSDGKVALDPDLPSVALGNRIHYTHTANFVTDDGALACPNKLYVEIRQATGEIPIRRYSFSIDDLDSNFNIVEGALVTSSSQAYTSPEGMSYPPYSNTCRYDDIYLNYGNGKYSLVSVPQWNKNSLFEEWKQEKSDVKLGNGIEYSNLPQSCPSQIYVSTDNSGNKTVYLSPIKSSTKIELSPVLSATALGFDRSIIINEFNVSERPAGCAIFGEHLTPIIRWIIDLIQIAVPLLIIILTIVDFIGIVLSGEEKNFKAAGTKFIKRIVIGVAVIFLPMLITFIVDLSGVLGSITQDDLFCSLFK